jgi:membrane protein insertase Oxa1/YidC/SpoIIIJ
MSAAFLLLFYPFPAAMVYYWTLANIFSAVQQRILKA